MLEDKIKGLRVELISDEIVEVYSFSSTSDNVAVTIGTKEGPLCGPLYQYKIISETSLMIYDESSSRFKWEAIEFGHNEMTVSSKDRKITYQTSKPVN